MSHDNDEDPADEWLMDQEIFREHDRAMERWREVKKTFCFLVLLSLACACFILILHCVVMWSVTR